MTGVAFRPLNWQGRRWSADEVASFRRVRRGLAPYAPSVGALAAACSAEFGRPLGVRVVGTAVAERPTAPPASLPVPLALAPGDVRLVAYVANALALRLAMLAVGKDVRVRPGEQRPLPPEAARGAAEAIARAARRTGRDWRLAASPPAEGPFGLVRAEVQVGDDAFGATLAVPLAPERSAFPRAALASLADLLGDAPLRLPVVASAACATDDELARLEPGVAWAPGDEAWTLRPAGTGAWEGGAVLVAPASEVGLAARAEPGGLRVTDARAGCPWDPTYYDAFDDEPGREGGLRVVRVEAGLVTLSARAWAAALEPGALLPWPRGGATMRVGGRAVARGRIAPVEGELAFCVEATLAAAPLVPG